MATSKGVWLLAALLVIWGYRPGYVGRGALGANATVGYVQVAGTALLPLGVLLLSYGATSTPLVRPLDPGERVSETYELRGDSLGVTDTGTQFVRGAFERPVLEDTVSAERDWKSFLPRVRVSIEEKGVL
ncbi:hypothetical protein [Salinigranum marinum]|uniref:hypothetical protein n=1 Tax=Salinigranum marinum TaxID=1515595 RepID=UPI002989CD08|nr:hypothetical protein [Salinigranum marinum]